MKIRIVSEENLFDVTFTETNLNDKNTNELRRALVAMESTRAAIRETLRIRGADGQ